MKNLTTFLARAAMLLLLAVFTTTSAQAQSTDPIVTGYWPLSGTVGHNSKENFPMLIDGDRTTKWCVTEQAISSTFYIEFYSQEAFVPTGYVLTTGNDNVSSPNRNPKSWVIKAAQSYSDPWTTIATVTNDNVLQDVNTTDFEFTIDNNAVYKYFRFEVTAVVGSGTKPVFQLGEFRFRGHAEVVGPVTTDLSTITSNYTAQNGEVLTGTLDTENHPVKISIADGATVTLSGVTINGINLFTYPWAGITCLGNATIFLAEGTSNHIKGFDSYYPGIYVPEGSTLCIKGCGSLNAESNGFSAGIGGGYNINCGNIIIEGGEIVATGKSTSAGIGGGYSKCGDISIIDTDDLISVTAIKGGTSAYASIGSALNSLSCGTVTIGGISYSGGIRQSPYTYVPIRNISLADGTSYTRTKDFSVTTATYTRTIEESRVGKHQSWFLPFGYAITADDLQKFSFYKINMIANAPNPGEGTSSDLWVFLTKLETAGTVLHANMPYVIKAKEAVTNYAFTSTNATLKAKNTGVILKTETAEDVYSFYATYEDTPASESDQFYYVSSLGNICLGTSVTIGPYRWIIRKTNKYGGTTSYVREMHFFDGEEDDATGLNEELRMKNEESSEDWYTLDGVKLSGKPTQKGIYIRGGRKEAIR